MLINSFKEYRQKYFLDIKLFFFVLCWCFFWLSINSKPSQLSGSGLEFLNGLRSIFPGLLVFPLSYFFFKNYLSRKIIFKKVDLLKIVFILLSTYLVCKVLGGLHLIGKENYLEFNYLTFSFLSVVLVCQNYLAYENSKSFIITISFISLFFLFVLTIFYIYVSFKVYFLDPEQILAKWMYSIHPITNEVFKSPYPRITGMSRIIAILSIINFIFFLISKKKNYKILLFLSFNFFSIVIWLMQSRGTLICFITTICVLLLFDSKLNKFKKIILMSLLLLIPYYSTELLTNFKFSYNVHKFYEKCIVDKESNSKNERICTKGGQSYAYNYEVVENFFKNKEIANKQILENKLDKNILGNEESLENSESTDLISNYAGNKSRLIKPHNHDTAGYTSGRTAIWKKIFSLYDFKRIFGLGAQGDRQILMGEESTFILSSNASNMIIYSFISSGYLGALSIIMICMLLSFKILQFFFKNKKLIYSDNVLELIGASILIFLLIRSIVENSFGVFSIDALLFVNGLMLLFVKFKFSIKGSLL